MLIHFKTRDKARKYASLGSKVIDKGVASPVGKRWACEAVIAPKSAPSIPSVHGVLVFKAPASNVPRETIKGSKPVTLIMEGVVDSLQVVSKGLEESLDAWRSERKKESKLRVQDVFK